MRTLPNGVVRYLLLALVMAVGVATTLFAVQTSLDNASERAQRAFETEVDLHVLTTKDHIDRALDGIEEVGGLFDASSTVSVDEFHTFASKTIGRHSAISAIGWAPVVPGIEREAFEANGSSIGSPGFEILDYLEGQGSRAATARLVYYPIAYSVTHSDSLMAAGVDVGSWPWVDGLIEQARDSGSLKVTPAFPVPTGGVLVAVLQPQYQGGRSTGTAIDRRLAFTGLVVGFLRPSELLNQSSDAHLNRHAVHGVAARVVEASALNSGLSLVEEPGFDSERAEFTSGVDLHAANQTWELTLASTSSFTESRDVSEPWLIFAMGLSITILVSGYLVVLQRRSATAETMLATRARQLAEANDALSREIHERAVREAVAVAERGQLQSILDTTVDGIITIDQRGTIQSFNRAAQIMFDYRADEVIGKNVTLLMPEPDKSGHDQYLRNYDETGERKIIGIGRDVVGQRKDGTTFPLELSVSEAPVTEGKLYTGIVRDITGRKESERRIEESEARLQAMFNSAPIGVVWSRPGEGIESANPMFLQIMGRTQQEVLDHRIADFAVPTDMAARWGTSRILIEGDDETLAVERQLIRGDGKPIWVQVTASRVRQADGTVRGIIRMVEDITERRRAIEELQASEERFRALIESAPVGIEVSSEKESATLVNPALLGMLRIKEGEFLGKRLTDFWYPGYKQQEGGSRILLLSGEANRLHYERLLQRSDGAPLWVNITASAVDSPEGRMILRIVEDVTERKQAEQEMKESEERFRSLFEAAPIGIAMVGVDRSVLAANSALARMLNTTVENLKGSAFNRYWPPVLAEDLDSFWGRVERGEGDNWQTEREVITPGARAAWVQITSSAIRDANGQVAYAIRMVEDITAIKQAETEIRSSEYRFRSLFDSSPVGIALIDQEGSVTSVNAALLQMLGIESNEVVGHQLSEFRSPDDPGIGGKHRVTLMSSDAEDRSFVAERLFRRGDGTEMWAQVVTAPIRDDTGNFLFGVRMVVDISERKQVEQIKDEFLSMVSHELRTPLTAIQAGVGLVASGALGQMPSKAERMLSIANDNAHRLMRLVNDVLDIEKMTAGRIVLERVDADLRTLVEQAVNSVGAIAAEANVEIQTRPITGAIVVDSDRIVQTLTNLIANAVKFSPPGGKVRVTVTQQATSVRFDVEDKGRGIPQEQLARIFDRFYQVDASDARAHSGTGLGLAISKWIVDEHGGKIWVESEVGTGSTFSFELPRVP